MFISAFNKAALIRDLDIVVEFESTAIFAFGKYLSLKKIVSINYSGEIGMKRRFSIAGICNYIRRLIPGFHF